MDNKNEYEISLIEEENERVVKVSIEEMPEDKENSFECEELKDEAKEISLQELKEENLISTGNIRANLIPKKPIKEYAYGVTFAILAIVTLTIGFLFEGYKMVGIICFVLAGLASFSMFNTIFDAKKIQRLLDEGKCKTVDELMLELKRKKKYEFMRNLGGMIRAGYVVGYEVLNGNVIRKVN